MTSLYIAPIVGFRMFMKWFRILRPGWVVDQRTSAAIARSSYIILDETSSNVSTNKAECHNTQHSAWYKRII